MLSSYKDYKSKYNWMQWLAFFIYLLFVGFFVWGAYYTCVRNRGVIIIWVFSIYVSTISTLFLYPQIYSFLILLRNIFTGKKIFGPYDKIVSTTVINNTSRVAIIYPCKDDFIEEAFITALHQDYPNCKVFILDDSTSPEGRKRVDDFYASHKDQFAIIRRSTGAKNKAGNINNFLSLYKNEFDYVAVLDADTYITRNFVSNCLKYYSTFNDVGLIQGCSYPLTNIKNNFQDACTPNYYGDKLYWANDAVATTEACITISIGHGCMYNMAALNKIGGYIPNCVAEDTATSVALLNAGYQTLFACNVLSMDETPPNFKAWKSRYLHWEVGNADFTHKYLGKVLCGKYSLAYKSYIIWWVIASWMTPFCMLTFNALGFACYYFNFSFYPIIPWLIGIVFTAFCASFIPQKNKTSKGSAKANMKCMLTMSCSAMSIMPTALLKHYALWFTKKSFKVTTKTHEKTKWYQTFTQNPLDHLGWMIYFGYIVFTCVWTKHWLFAVNPILLMGFVAYISLFIIPYMGNKVLPEPKNNELYKGL